MAGATIGGISQPAVMSTTQPAQAYQATQQPNVFNQASQGLSASMMGTAAGMGYQPQQVGAVTYSPAQLQNQSLQPYANPFEQQVIGGLQNDAFSQYQKMNNQLGAEATAAGAFGGSRHGVAQGAMATGVQSDLNKQIAGLRMGGFQNAQQMALQDIAARNQAMQYGGSNMMQAQLANQSAGLSGAQQRLGAANQLGNLANLGFGMGMQTQESMAQQGALQQAMQQMLMDKAAQQWTGYQNSPYQALNAMTTALGAMPNQSTTTQTGNQKRSLFDYLAMGASVWPS